MQDKGAMKLSHAWQSQEKRGVGVRRVAIAVAWAAPPQKTGRGTGRWAPTSGPGRWHGSREDGLLPSPRALLQTLTPFGASQARPANAWGLSPRRTEAMKKRPPRGSGRESPAPSRPDTSLRPVTALGRSCYRSFPGWSHNSPQRSALLPSKISQTAGVTRGQWLDYRRSLGFPHAHEPRRRRSSSRFFLRQPSVLRCKLHPQEDWSQAAAPRLWHSRAVD